MGSDNGSQRKFELSPVAFGELAEKLDAHIGLAASRGVHTSISIQNGFHFDSKKGEHHEIDLGEQQETFAASQAKLAVVAFKLVQDTVDKDTHHDLLSMLRISDNGAFIRQKRDIAPEVIDFAKSELEISTDILTIRGKGSYAGKTTARDSLRMFLKTLQLAHAEAKISKEKAQLSNDINNALSSNNTKYGVRTRLEPYTGLYLLNKTGDYYGEDDEEVQEAVHHDVGVLLYKVKDVKRRLAYSITSSADSRLGAFKADRLNQIAGATLIEAIGGTPKSALKASLGSAARKLFSR